MGFLGMGGAPDIHACTAAVQSKSLCGSRFPRCEHPAVARQAMHLFVTTGTVSRCMAACQPSAMRRRTVVQVLGSALGSAPSSETHMFSASGWILAEAAPFLAVTKGSGALASVLPRGFCGLLGFRRCAGAFT